MVLVRYHEYQLSGWVIIQESRAVTRRPHDAAIIIRIITFEVSQPIWTRYLNVTDRQTDRRTDRMTDNISIAISRSAKFITRCKNGDSTVHVEWSVWTADTGSLQAWPKGWSLRPVDAVLNLIRLTTWTYSCVTMKAAYYAALGILT